MPAEGVHLTALREAVFGSAIAAPVRRCVLRFEAAARLGSIGPDLPYFDRYGEELVRYAVRRPSRPSPWGARIHGGGAIALVRVALEQARTTRSELVAALAIGLASHACIDRSIHPLVNALARRFPERPSHDGSHREVEKFQSILFHERYFGRDAMGTAGIVRLVEVPALELLRTTAAGAALERGFGLGADDPATRRPLRRMAAGYEMHAKVLGSPLGRRVAPSSEKARARPLFLEGPWGAFERVLEEAIALSRPVLEAGWAVFDAEERDVDRAWAELDERLPPGSIEGQGGDVDLDRPFVTRPPRQIAA